MKRRHVRKNQVKEQQTLKKLKIRKHAHQYCDDKSYMNITVVHLCDIPMILDEVQTKFNFIVRETIGLSNHEITYLSRASDLLLLTVTGSEVNKELISLIKRYMPTAIILHERKQKNIARSLAKEFGEVKICEVSMLGMVLSKIETQNTHLANFRPFMVAKDFEFDGNHLIIKGFMKKGLRSDKITINGIHQGLIEDVMFNETVLHGSQLNIEEVENTLAKEAEEYQADENLEPEPLECDSESIEMSVEDEEFEQITPKYDLISKYKTYKGIRNLATCNFKNQSIPEHYKDLVFVKNMKYMISQVKAKQSLIPNNTEVTLKVRIFEPINEKYLVIFNLIEYETRKTIHNYDFHHSESVSKNILIDNGFLIFNSSCILTRNLNNNVFKEEADLNNGVMSFIGHLNLYPHVAHVLLGNNINSIETIKLMNGRNEDRIFFECVELKGKPIKVYKSYVVVRGMFFNKEQVDYFRNIQIESKNGIVGHIMKPLGTKGQFKGYFAQHVKHGDSIKMCLYKRVFL